MKNFEAIQILEEIKWLENIPKDTDVLDEIADMKDNPDEAFGELLLTEECFDEEDLYDLDTIITSMLSLSQNDLAFHEIKELFNKKEELDETYEDPQRLFDDVNTILKNKGIEKAFYILPRVDQLVFYVYKPISVYEEAVKRRLISA